MSFNRILSAAFPPREDELIRETAKRLRQTKSELIREAVTRYLTELGVRESQVGAAKALAWNPPARKLRVIRGGKR